MIRSIIFGVFFFLALAAAAKAAERSPADTVGAEAFGSLPVYFIENQGQIDSKEVAYHVKGADKTLYFTSEGITFALARDVGDEMERWTVKLSFLGANEVKPVVMDKQQAIFSYFKGKPEDWKTGLPTYGKLVYEDLWPGIDLVYSGTANQLKYEFVVAPGADPDAIRLEYTGAEDVAITDAGTLKVTTPVGGFVDDVPYAYQIVEGEEKEVSMHYALSEETDESVFSFGFDLGKYDPTMALVLDPSLLVYCGYIGGIDEDNGYGIAVDRHGCAYVTGYTMSDHSSFPVKVGPDLWFSGGYLARDAFVAKVNAQGTDLEYCGYIGGSGFDVGHDIAVDDDGNAYVTGGTSSNESSFPVVVGPDLFFNGESDAFVAKVNAAGTDLDYCGYIGGIESDYANGIALDSQRNAYIGGTTHTDDSSFPVTVGPDLTFNGGDRDVFAAKVNAQGTGLDFCGYIGGNQNDSSYRHCIAVDGQGSAYMTGTTTSDESTFPVVVGPDLTYNEWGDAFVAKINAQGTGLDYCGYIGGDLPDGGTGVAVDGDGRAYVTGGTVSDELSFPVKVGPDLVHNGQYGDSDAFVARVNADGSDLEYCGYIGGKRDDKALDIDVDDQGNAYVMGDTGSDESTFPVIVGPDLTFNGEVDTFVAKVNAQGTGLDYCGYIGGCVMERGHGIAVDGWTNAYVTGWARSEEGTFPVMVGPDLTFNGNAGGEHDAFVAKVSYGDVVPDIKIDGQDGPLTVPATQVVRMTVSLDPGSQEGVAHDWWIGGKLDQSDLYCWSSLGGWMYCPNGYPFRAYGGPLVDLTGFTICQGRLPVGSWTFVFVLDYANSLYEGSYLDSIEVTSY